ncbi:acyltransferase family protein [Isoptericola jiangsuensis]|uniref:acyltransferase family protein n=1 Tax=Isoptericola jiangsuensis TaxID=548579 RepID=UPI003AAB3FDD
METTPMTATSTPAAHEAAHEAAHGGAAGTAAPPVTASRTTAPATTAPCTSAPRAAVPRMHLLDLLRFGAAAAVVIYHFTATPTASQYWGTDVSELFGPLNHVTRYGWLAVEAFFVISGFAILISTQGRTVAQFTGSRIGRLYPALWACVLLTAVLQTFWAGGRDLSLADTVANLTMAPDLFGAELSQVVYWTLLVELKFYVLVGVLLAFGPITRGRAIALALAWPAVGITVRALGYPMLAEHLVIRHSVYFGIGMMLFLLWKDATDRRHGMAAPDGRRGSILTLGALAALLVLATARVRESADGATSLQGVEVYGWVSVGIFFGSVAAVWLAGHPRARISSRPLATLAVTAGALTYPLYLVHTQFGWAVTEVLTVRGAGTWSVLTAATVASLVLAAVIHHAVERPFSTRLRRAVTTALAARTPVCPTPVARPLDESGPDHAVPVMLVQVPAAAQPWMHQHHALR